MRVIRIAACVFAGLYGTLLGAADGPLTLAASAVRASYSGRDPVLVRLTLENSSFPADWESRFFVLVPRLTFGRPPAPSPYLVVRFEILDPDGRLLVSNPNAGTLPKLVPPEPAWFAELHAGQFFGRVVDLRAPWLGFSFAKPGTYLVTPTVSTDARLWLDTWLKEHHRKKDTLLFSYADVFQGSLVANVVSVTMTE